MLRRNIHLGGIGQKMAMVSAARAFGVKAGVGSYLRAGKKPSMLKIPPAPDRDHAPGCAG
jgi:hypothetical protein